MEYFFYNYQIHRGNFCLLRMINYYLNVKNCKHVLCLCILGEPFVLSLEKPLHHFPAGMACVDDDGAVYHRKKKFSLL